MRQIFVFTAGDKNARVHLQDSILKSVPFAWMQESIGVEQTDFFKSLYPDGVGFHAWGAVPGPVNKRTWDAMQVGDLVLTVYDNQYHFLSSVIGKLNDKALASRIWGTDEDGDTWEYMYLLSRPQRLSIHVLSEPVVNYLNKGYRGYTRISDEKVLAVFSAFGSLDNFVQQVFHGQIPPTHVERELAEARAQAEDTAGFNPEDLVDGRKKVMREIVRRQGQPKFRRQLFEVYEGQCAVTGCNVEAVLEAAHIAPYFGSDSNAVQNGLLLRADIHTLFDLGQLKITPAGRVELHEKLFGTAYAAYQNKYIRRPANPAQAPSAEALQLKFNIHL